MLNTGLILKNKETEVVFRKMLKKQKPDTTNEEVENLNENVAENTPNTDANASEAEVLSLKEENQKLTGELEEKTKKCDEYLQMLQRNAAEFDNYKKRTQKEKEALSIDISADTVLAFLPVVDNMERALAAINGESTEVKALKDGVDMVYKQLLEAFKKLSVEEIASEGQSFDPELHNAVMHIEDESVGENIIVEVFQKGYKLKDKVIRHSMVKVAN